MTIFIGFILAVIVSAVAGYLTRSVYIEKHATQKTREKVLGLALIATALSAGGVILTYALTIAGVVNLEAMGIALCVLSFCVSYVYSALTNGTISFF